VLDIGFIHHKKDVRNLTARGTFAFEGINFQFDNENNSYIEDLEARFRRELVVNENENSYKSWRPIKMNAAIKYSFGDKVSKRINSYFSKDFYTDATGIQLYSVYTPLSPQLALTAFYQKAITNKIHTKLTYTIDDFSYTNIGAGISAQFGYLNIYAMVDNILEYRDLSSANHLSVQLGINLIVN
jgi:hypothetical protein